MSLYSFSMFLTIVSNVGYHLFQRQIHPDSPPFFSLAASYVVGLFTTVLIVIFFPALNASATLKDFGKVGWASYLLGLALVGLELGFLLAYRAGWKISSAALISNIAVTLVLIPIGIFLYRDGMNFSKFVGILFSLVGLWLLGRK